MRKVRVATMFFPGGQATPQGGLDFADLAGQDKADIFCLPEKFCGDPKRFRLKKGPDRAEPVPGPTTDAMARKARKYGMYIVCPVLEREADGLRNTVVLLDRRGKIVGRYFKQVPTIGEMEQGIRPGTEIKAIETDIGRIGFAVCYDLNFVEVMEAWRKQRVDLFFWPSAFEGGLMLAQWAFHLNAYVISSNHGEVASILDVTGRPLALARWHHPFVAATLNLERKLYHWDTTRAVFARLKRTYGPGVSSDFMVPEGRVALTCEKPGLTLKKLEREFKLERCGDYLDRALRMRDEQART